MIDLQESDDQGFIERINQITSGIFRCYPPDHVYVIRVDDWFDSNRLTFSGRSFLTEEPWRGRLPLPPFALSRIVSEKYYQGNQEQQAQTKLHIDQPSGNNLQRFVDLIVPNATIIWFSGNSKKNEKGSLMAYVAGPKGFWPWYLGFAKSGDWKITGRKGISADEVKALEGGAG